ncbi:MAG TPA: hypothetical protein VGY55_13770 [Pirellulales bacterium]|jgi:hypothetical protein|nr:hypothetical protein [Pirellulales bacterium]
MPQHINSVGRRPWQFSLGALFATVTFVALASAAAKYYAMAVGDIRSSLDPIGLLLAFFSVPILLCCAVGVLRGRLRSSLAYGVAIDIFVVGLVLLFTARSH